MITENHVYIGSRYIAKIEDEWDISKSYENFSIVFKDNIAYISKKNVPNGIELDNKEYWVKCFNLININSKLADIEKRLKELEDK